MLFSSLVFLWLFLPAVFFLCMALKKTSWKNILLLAASLFFYGWGEPKYVNLMILSIGINYLFGLLAKQSRFVTVAAVAVNLGILGYFKYFNFLLELLAAVFGRELLTPREIALPIGISFYTFQALSYVLDVHRGTIKPQKSIWKLALYISFFPQLIAGPIVKYHDIEMQLESRTVTWSGCAGGVKRFIFGLSKKVLLANTFAAVVDRAFSAPYANGLSRGMILMAVLLYSLQIYYDFSGYSDMAIGLGKMFGFTFMENFRYPYLSGSIREFWRRWHISLSAWFREYLYIPLGGSRRGALRTCGNLFVVFFTTGLWHGAGGNFVLWGIYHGIFIVAERLFLGKILDRLKESGFGILNRVYALTVVYFGWMLFRLEDLSLFKLLMKKLVLGWSQFYETAMFMDARVWFWLISGIFFCGPLQTFVKPLGRFVEEKERICAADLAVLAVLLLLCVMMLINNTYNPFIYFRF